MAVKQLRVDVLLRGTCKKCRRALIRMIDIDLWLDALGENEESNVTSARLLLEGHLCLLGKSPGEDFGT